MLRHARWLVMAGALLAAGGSQATAARVGPVEDFWNSYNQCLNQCQQAWNVQTYQICPSPGQSGMADSVTCQNEANWARVTCEYECHANHNWGTPPEP